MRKEKVKEQVCQYIDANKDWIIETIFEIVSVDTINTPPIGNENNGQNILEKIFRELGLTIDRFSPDDVPGFKDSAAYLRGRDYNNRENLIGVVGEGKKQTLIFNGHMDTVPSHDFIWKKTDPFKPKLLDGRIYGLGTCDMKGGLVASLFALKSFLDLDIPITGKVIIESVVDEEFGGGNGTLACVMKGYDGDYAIIAEPSFMDICLSNVCSKVINFKIKGTEELRYVKKGIQGANPIILTTALINTLIGYEEHLNSLKDRYNHFRDLESPIRFLFSDIKAGDLGDDKIVTTPKDCQLRVYLMDYPDINEKKFYNRLLSFLKKEPSLSGYIDDESIILELNVHRFIEGGTVDMADDRNREFVDKIIENSWILSKRKLKTSAFLGGTDFFAFNNYGHTPAIVFGPGGGNCHAADEYVNVKDLMDISKIYAALIYDYCC